jgi:Na+/proline symporter
MHLQTLDLVIIAVAISICFIPALLVARRAGKNTGEFFAAGRAAPWWLIGISMVATTFSADTPNLVTNMVRTGGVASNWQWWAFALTGMATVFFYARLWRRSGVLTDLEFYELRYSGKGAVAVRGFRSVYLGLFFNCVIMATVNLAAAKIAAVALGWPMWETLLICMSLKGIFAVSSGLWGVLIIDMVQFGITMTGSFAMAYFAVKAPQVGGMAGLLALTPTKQLSIFPSMSDPAAMLTLLILPLTINWWSVWYPGAEPGGGSYIAQRMLAAKTERDALYGTLFFNFMHYVVRPWPWIIVALSSMLVYPHLADIHHAFPHVAQGLVKDDIAYPAMFRCLPHGWLGLVLAGLLSAYGSTIITHLNWGTSYLVHDFYRRFLRPNSTERHYVLVGRLATLGLMILAGSFTFFLQSAQDAFNLILSIGAGTGLLYLLRWFWWRINAACEIAAMVSSFLLAFGFFVMKNMGHEVPAPWPLLLTIGLTTIVWVTTAFVSNPTDDATLNSFYRKIRPEGPGWKVVRDRLAEQGEEITVESTITSSILAWTLGVLGIWTGLFAIGSFVYEKPVPGAILTFVFVLCCAGLIALMQRMWPRRDNESPEPERVVIGE